MVPPAARFCFLAGLFRKEKIRFSARRKEKLDEDGREEEPGADSVLRQKIQLGKPETTNKVKLFIKMQKR